MKYFLLMTSMLFAPEDGAGGGLAAAAAASADAADAGTDAAAAAAAAGKTDTGKPDAAAAATPYRPKDLPDHLFGASDQETIDKLHKAVSGFRQQQGEQGTVPKDVSGYKFEPGEKLAPYMAGMKDDPLYKDILGAAKDAGMTERQFATFMPKVLERLLETGNVAAPVNYDEHITALVPKEALSLDQQGQTKAAGQRIRNALDYVEGAVAQGLPKEVGDFIVAQLGDHKYGIQAIEFFKGLDRKVGPIFERSRVAGASTDAELDQLMQDPRYNPNSPKFDRDFAATVDKKFQEHYGS